MNPQAQGKKEIQALALLAAAFLLFFQFSCVQGEKPIKPPAAEIKNVQEVLHDTEVNDPYRWLENWETPAVQAWSESQNAYARSILDNLPSLKEISARVSEIENAVSTSYSSLTWKGRKLFALKDQPPLNQPLLIKMDSPDRPESEKVIVDLNTLNASGGTSMDWYVPSWDGRLVGVSLSKGGSESGDVHIFETESARQIGEVIERVNGGTAGGDMAWLPDGSGFYYTRYPRPGERPAEDLNFYQQVWLHRLGTAPESDRYIMGKDFPRTAEIRLAMDERSGRLLVTIQYGDSGRFAHHLLNPDGAVQQITDFDDGIVEAIWGAASDLFLISLKDAPRGKILHLTLDSPSLDKAKLIIPEGAETIISSFGSSLLAATPSRLFVTYQLGGPSEIRVFSHDGKALEKPEILPVSSIYQLAAFDEDILYLNASYLESPSWYRFHAADGTTSRTALFSRPPVDYGDAEVVREFAASKDGTKVPVNIMMLKGTKLDGSNPTILNGYGGFGVSLSPGFSALRRLWIEQGGIYALANIRGGGEFGEDWHRAGSLTKKQNCFDDFAAAMQHLVERGYTRPAKLAVIGGSNGGLLMGAMITQNPGLFRATVSSVGIYDLLRNELTPNGNFNIPEYGTVKDPEQFKALYAYSPYHNVKDGVAYPAVLFMTGANDPRVDPMHSRKMAARLQAATASKNPILLRTSSTTGHGIDTPLSERVKEDVDEFAFLFHELGVKYKAVK